MVSNTSLSAPPCGGEALDLVEWRKNALDHDLYISTTSAETAFSRPRRLAYTFDVPMPS